MAPVKPSAGKGGAKPKTAGSKGKPSGGSSSKFKGKRPPPKEMKAKPRSAPELQRKKKKREYTEKELNLPALNTITPVGVQKPRGKKKGKVFVDDPESMATILAIVNAEKDGQIESKMMKSRQMEEIREARRKEAEARQEKKKSSLEETKDSLRRKRKPKSGGDAPNSHKQTSNEDSSSKPRKDKKRVSFA
ncbi:60S ribosomal subunit assembly/export protein [Arachnomyces sp. PD_36]|nr:60S ribosomal subunit assembly/export protein [Arachnomyces sp. PD_36]